MLLGVLPGIYMAKKNYLKFKKTHDSSMYEIRYKFVAKSIDSIVYGFGFIIGMLLWPLSLIEIIGDKK
jgi:hypothetical protein